MRTTVFGLFLCILTAFAAPANAENPVPASEKLKLNAAIGPYGFYPTSLPSGLRFMSWKTTQLTPMACGLNLDISFAGDGKHLDWSSSRDCGETASPNCYKDGYPGYGFGMLALQSAR